MGVRGDFCFPTKKVSIGGLLKPIKSWGQNFLVVLGFAVIQQSVLQFSITEIRMSNKSNSMAMGNFDSKFAQ